MDWRVAGCCCGAVGVEARVVGYKRQVVADRFVGCVRTDARFGHRLFGAWCQYAGDVQDGGRIACCRRDGVCCALECGFWSRSGLADFNDHCRCQGDIRQRRSRGRERGLSFIDRTLGGFGLVQIGSSGRLS